MTDKLIMTTEQREKQYAALENSIDAVTQEITDHKTMWGEDAIPSRVAQRQNLVLKEREHKDAMEMLQSLPMVDSEPPRGVPNLEDFAKQLCTEHGSLDIYETVYRDQGNSYTPYSGQPAWSTYVLDAEYALNAYEKCAKLYTSPQALTNREIAEKCAEICRSRSRSISADGHNTAAANEASKCALSIESHWQTYPSKALTPITADDVTDEMLLVFLDALDTPMNYRATLAAAYNAFIKNRIEA